MPTEGERTDGGAQIYHKKIIGSLNDTSMWKEEETLVGLERYECLDITRDY